MSFGRSIFGGSTVTQPQYIHVTVSGKATYSGDQLSYIMIFVVYLLVVYMCTVLV